MPVRNCLTSAGDGDAPWWYVRYAWMTSAAAPAVTGDDSLVPPKSAIGVGWPLKFTHWVKMAVLAEHSAQSASPGATRSGTCPP